MSYRKKLITIFAAIIGFCSAAMIAIEYQTERHYKRSLLQSNLEVYADMIAKQDSLNLVLSLLPENLRITVLDISGTVYYDSYSAASTMENHFSRPEIQSCQKKKDGYCIRFSETTSQKYLYYAKKYAAQQRIIRVALPFEISLKDYFRPDWLLWLEIALFFCSIFLLFILLSNRYSKKIALLEEEKQRNLKHQMTSNIAHELRTPVSSIRGYLETLVNNPQLDSEKRKLFLERSYLQTIRLSDLIRDIALITKIEESPELFHIETIDMKIVVEEVLDEFKETLLQKGIQIENNITQATTLQGNYPLLYALIRNLVENSIKYSGSETTIHLSCEKKRGGWQFTFYDTGVGTGEEDLPHIFERFYRSPKQMAVSNDGSGLGLSIVRNAVVFHHGEITAQNRKEGGLMFVFTLAVG